MLPLLDKTEVSVWNQRTTLFPMKVSACTFLGSVCVVCQSGIHFGSRGQHTHRQACTLIFSAVTPSALSSLLWTAEETFTTHRCDKSNTHHICPPSNWDLYGHATLWRWCFRSDINEEQSHAEVQQSGRVTVTCNNNWSTKSGIACEYITYLWLHVQCNVKQCNELLI